MDSKLMTFENAAFGKIRTITIDGEPWFVAVDVCKALQIANSRDALTRIDDDEKGVVLTDTLGGKQEVTIVNEPGLYTLVLSSRKPEAKAFKRWITHEVIPVIRKHGAYISPNAEAVQVTPTIEQYAERRKTMSINTKWTPHGEFGHATKTFVAACDYCGAELEQCETYSEAILSTREHGWRNELRSDGSWANICPDCVEQYFSV